MIEASPPTLAMMREAQRTLAPLIVRTPALEWSGSRLAPRLGDIRSVVLKLELFQKAGSFKLRGAFLNLLALTDEARTRGVTTVSSGNHAVAVAYAAQALGIDAKVVMLSSANPVRVALAKSYGADVILGGSGIESFALAASLADREGRTIIHPYEGIGCTLGAATMALEFIDQAGPFDSVIVPIGGGGLASGVGAAIKALHPECMVYGVEPIGADTMRRSFAAGSAQRLDCVDTIADSLGPPTALPYSFAMCRRFVDEIVVVDDDRLCNAMALLFEDMKLAVEPAAAAATAALLGPLRARLSGQRTGVIICGANIDAASFYRFVSRGLACSPLA